MDGLLIPREMIMRDLRCLTQTGSNPIPSDADLTGIGNKGGVQKYPLRLETPKSEISKTASNRENDTTPIGLSNTGISRDPVSIRYA